MAALPYTGVYSRETQCAVCQRWCKTARMGYLALDQYDDQRRYPLCPWCLELGTVLGLWVSRRGVISVPRLIAMVRAAYRSLTADE